MQLIPYLSFNGQCEEAFQLYAQVLGGEIKFIAKYEGTPAAETVPPEWRGKIMHVTMAAGDRLLQGADAPPNYYTKPQGFSINIETQDPAEAERLFQAFSEGGTVRMPLQETFWAAKFGMVIDRFGTPWLINCSKAA